MPKNRELKVWRVPITPKLDSILEKALEVNAYVSKSDFIREAVREKLAKMGLMETSAEKSSGIEK
ncbi:MAG: hypothetical protein ACP5LB_07380 [Candidatus Bathyarchaeia archaeon]